MYLHEHFGIRLLNVYILTPSVAVASPSCPRTYVGYSVSWDEAPFMSNAVLCIPLVFSDCMDIRSRALGFDLNIFLFPST